MSRFLQSTLVVLLMASLASAGGKSGGGSSSSSGGKSVPVAGYTRKDGTQVIYRVQSEKAVALCRSVCTQIAIEMDEPDAVPEGQAITLRALLPRAPAMA